MGDPNLMRPPMGMDPGLLPLYQQAPFMGMPGQPWPGHPGMPPQGMPLPPPAGHEQQPAGQQQGDAKS